MNKYVKMFMDDHNLKVGDEFRKKGTDAYGIWHFDKDGCLINEKGSGSNKALVKFLLGEYEVEKVKKEPWKPKPWKPKLHDSYWYVSCFGNVCYTKYTHDKDDEYMLTHNPVFQTKIEANDYKWFLDKIDEYKKPFKPGTNNCSIYYGHDAKEIYKHYACYHQSQGVVYFGNKENVEKFIEEVGEDRIKKYWFNVFEADK